MLCNRFVQHLGRKEHTIAGPEIAVGPRSEALHDIRMRYEFLRLQQLQSSMKQYVTPKARPCHKYEAEMARAQQTPFA